MVKYKRKSMVQSVVNQQYSTYNESSRVVLLVYLQDPSTLQNSEQHSLSFEQRSLLNLQAFFLSLVLTGGFGKQLVGLHLQRPLGSAAHPSSVVSSQQYPAHNL